MSTGKRIDFVIAGGAAGMLTQVTRLDMDGLNVYSAAATQPPIVTPPEPSPGTKLVGVYFSGDRLGADVAFKKPPYAVVADIPREQAQDPDVAAHARLEGSGEQMPAILYVTDERTGLVKVDNPEHPYFAEAAPPELVKEGSGRRALTKDHVEQLAQAAPLVQQVITTALSGANPLTLWETERNTTPPGPMSALLMLTGAGRESMLRAIGYRLWYYQTWGQQAPGGINHEVPSAAEMDFIRSIPKEAVAALAAGKEVSFNYTWRGSPANWI